MRQNKPSKKNVAKSIPRVRAHYGGNDVLKQWISPNDGSQCKFSEALTELLFQTSQLKMSSFVAAPEKGGGLPLKPPAQSKAEGFREQALLKNLVLLVPDRTDVS